MQNWLILPPQTERLEVKEAVILIAICHRGYSEEYLSFAIWRLIVGMHSPTFRSKQRTAPFLKVEE
jgi:hypothetical protein